MQIPAQITIRTEDFPSQQEWIGKLLFPLNQFLLAAVNAINGNLTFGDNIPCQTQSFSFTFGAQTDFPKNFRYNLATRPIELRICQAFEDGVAIALVPSWYFDNNNVIVTNFLKLTANGVVSLTRGSVYNIIVRAQP